MSLHISSYPSLYPRRMRPVHTFVHTFVHTYHMWEERRCSRPSVSESEVENEKRCLLITLNYNDPARLRCSNHRFHYSRSFCAIRQHTHTHTGPCTHSSTHCFFQPADGRLNEAETTSCRTLSLPDSLCVSVCEHCYYHFICKPSAFSLTVIHLQQESDRPTDSASIPSSSSSSPSSNLPRPSLFLAGSPPAGFFKSSARI